MINRTFTCNIYEHWKFYFTPLTYEKLTLVLRILPMIFSWQPFWGNRRLPKCNLKANSLITHLFTDMNLNLGVPYFVKVVRRGGGGGSWNSRILILPITKIFDKIYACELTFPNLLYRKFRENRMFLWFFSRKSIFAYSLCVYFQYFQNFEVALTLWRHSRLHNDVIVTSYADGWY